MKSLVASGIVGFPTPFATPKAKLRPLFANPHIPHCGLMLAASGKLAIPML